MTRRPGELTRFEACAMSACFSAALVLVIVAIVYERLNP